MEERTAQLELGSFIIENEITINYIRKPSSDIILALRQIDSNVLRGSRIKEDRGTPAAYELPPGSSEANSRVSVRHCCQTMSIPLYAASAAEITLFKSCNALGCRAPCASVLTGKSAIELLKLFGRPHQAESLRRELERVGDPSLRGKVYTPSPDAKGDDAPRKRRAAEPKPRKLMVIDSAGESPSLKAKRVRRQPRQWLHEAGGAEEDEHPLPALRTRREDVLPGVRGLSVSALGLSALGVEELAGALGPPDCAEPEHGVRGGWMWGSGGSDSAGSALLGRPTASLALAGASALTPLRLTPHITPSLAHAHAPTLLTTALANVAASTASAAATASMATASMAPLAGATGAVHPAAGLVSLSSPASLPGVAAPLGGLGAGLGSSLAGRLAPSALPGVLPGAPRGFPSLPPTLWRAQSHAAPHTAPHAAPAKAPSRDSAKDGLLWRADSRDEVCAHARAVPPPPSPAAPLPPPSPSAGTGLSSAALHALDGARHLRCEQCGRAAHLPLCEALRHGAEASDAHRALMAAGQGATTGGTGATGDAPPHLQPADMLVRALAVDCAQAGDGCRSAHVPASDACSTCPFAVRGGAHSSPIHCHRLCAVLLLVAQAPQAPSRAFSSPTAHGAPLSPPLLSSLSSASCASSGTEPSSVPSSVPSASSPSPPARPPRSPGSLSWPTLVAGAAATRTPTQAFAQGVQGVGRANPYAAATGPSLSDFNAAAALVAHGAPAPGAGDDHAAFAHADAFSHATQAHAMAAVRMAAAHVAAVHATALPRGRSWGDAAPSVSAGE